MSKDFKTINVNADIHPDGDVYIEKDGTMYLIGCLVSKKKVVGIPNKSYIIAKGILNK